MKDLSWQWGLCWLGIAYVVVSILFRAIAKWHSKRYLRIPYSRLNEFRVTPRFTVGGDVK